MKNRKTNKKLSLKKETISNLNQVEMNGIKGGTVYTFGIGCTILYTIIGSCFVFCETNDCNQTNGCVETDDCDTQASQCVTCQVGRCV